MQAKFILYGRRGCHLCDELAAALADRGLAVDPAVAYGMLDGLFQQALLAYGDDGEATLEMLSSAVATVLPKLLAPAP